MFFSGFFRFLYKKMKVGIIGHSQLREFHINSLNIEHEKIEVAKFWRSGARVSNILDTHVFEHFKNFNPDHAIIFLGGNDVRGCDLTF